jgi:hypothetical protein
MAIPADEPLFVESRGMLGNARQVNGFISSRLLGHHLSALSAFFYRHRWISYSY